jgi:hypothetical protein
MDSTDSSNRKRAADPAGRAIARSRLLLRLPFKFTGRAIARIVQVFFALFVVILHPQIKWLIGLITKSAFVRKVIKPAFRALLGAIYEPYFAYLRELPPLWATVSIALPLAVLEPAKMYATILIAQRPKMGILLWLFLQAISFVMIDKTWAAVRPQSRKLWLVSHLHAFVWLNVTYGKHWIKTSAFYQTLVRWKQEAREQVRAFFALFARRRGR